MVRFSAGSAWRKITGSFCISFALLAPAAALANDGANECIQAPSDFNRTRNAQASENDDRRNALNACKLPGDSVAPSVTVITTPNTGNVTVIKGPFVEHVTASKASDALGQPIDFFRPARQILVAPHLSMAMSSLTSGFGLRRHPLLGTRRAHLGADLAAATGSPIVATSDGVVSRADWFGSYGLYVALEHGGGLQTRYGHMSRLNVVAGQRVRAGDIIGFVGSTGRSTGPHLHYEVRINGQAVNPLRRVIGY